jgi:ABC-type Fe3+-siderophore transport system permease subunit
MNWPFIGLVAPVIALMILDPVEMIPVMVFGACLLALCIYLMEKAIGKK